MLKTVLNAVLRQTKMVAHIEIGRFHCQSLSCLTGCAVRVAYKVLSIHLNWWCNKNDLTDTVLCLKWQCLLNICKLKRQTTTVRYSVAIIIYISLTSSLSKYETYYSVTYLYFVCAILALENYD